MAPIALFVYNRLSELDRTIKALQMNDLAGESQLIIFSDGPANDLDGSAVAEVRAYLRMISGFKDVEIHENADNLGLAVSIIAGVTEVISRYGRVIVMEDDLVTSPFFLRYMNDALDCYEGQAEVGAISGFSCTLDNIGAETYFLPGTYWWGWATWKDRWELFNPDSKYLYAELKRRQLRDKCDINGSFLISPSKLLKKHIEGKISTWAIRWHVSLILAGKYSLFPVVSMVENIGLGSGVNCRVRSNCFSQKTGDQPVKVTRIPVAVDSLIVKRIRRFYLKAHFILLCCFIRSFFYRGKW